MESYADAFCVFVGQQLLICPLVACERLWQVSSAVKDVCDIDFQACQPQIFTGFFENLFCCLGSR